MPGPYLCTCDAFAILEVACIWINNDQLLQA